MNPERELSYEIEREKRRRARRERKEREARRRRKLLIRCCLLAVILMGIKLWLDMGSPVPARVSFMLAKAKSSHRNYEEDSEIMDTIRPDIEVDLLTPNEYSRPQTPLEEVTGVVIHYTANPGSSAKANRNYFENLQHTHTTSASSHFVVGLNGEIVQCIPCKEIAYATKQRNKDTISIECCIEDESGKFNDDTYASAVELTAWLVVRYNLTSEEVIRHYDVTGKNCPKYFVEHEDEWKQFRKNVEKRAKEMKKEVKGK